MARYFDDDLYHMPKNFISAATLHIIIRESDENKLISVREIKRKLIEDFGFKDDIDTKTVRTTIRTFCQSAEYFDINLNLYDMNKELIYSTRKFDEFDDDETTFYYCCLDHMLSAGELYHVLDILSMSEALTPAERDDLIDKIFRLAGNNVKKPNPRTGDMDEVTGNLFEVISTIHEAIERELKIQFMYRSFEIESGRVKEVLATDEDGYEIDRLVSPFKIVVNNGRDYLIAAEDDSDVIKTYRLDWMREVELFDKDVPARSLDELDQGKSGISRLVQSKLYMRDSDKVTSVTLEFDNSIIEEIVDWFGQDKTFIKIDDKKSKVVIPNVNEEAILYWLMQYGHFVRVIEPEHMVKKAKEMIKQIWSQYED